MKHECKKKLIFACDFYIDIVTQGEERLGKVFKESSKLLDLCLLISSSFILVPLRNNVVKML